MNCIKLPNNYVHLEIAMDGNTRESPRDAASPETADRDTELAKIENETERLEF